MPPDLPPPSRIAAWDESFGIVPLACRSGFWEVFLIRHKHGRHWGFPKGHAEAGENSCEAAIRELKEETNLDVVRFLREEPFREHYQFVHERQRIYKRVSYFVAEVSGTVFLQQKEVVGGLWLALDKAYLQLTHREGKKILSEVEKILPPL